MKKFNADKFREGLGKKHQITELELPTGEEIILRNPMRMPSADRKAMNKLFDDWNERFPKVDPDDPGFAERAKPSDDDMMNHLRGILKILVGDKRKADLLLKSDLAGDGTPVGEDLASMDFLLELHSGGDLGEASPSQD